MHLSADLIDYSPSFINAIKDTQLDLRSNKIATIESLGVTKDQHDTLDFTDNDIRRFENFPLMNRVRSIYMSNNRVSKIDGDCAKNLPNLEALVLANNLLEDLSDLTVLGCFERLTRLCLIGNPVAKHVHYRLSVISKVPSLKVLDFRKVTVSERKEAEALFGAKKNTFVPGEGLAVFQSKEEKKKIVEAIENVSSLEEMAAFKMKFISQSLAREIDEHLFEIGFSIEQLMELAGLSVAQAILKLYPPSDYPNPIICCGPGNNGGDGLVAARHLSLFGYAPTLLYPKPTEKPLFLNLIKQCQLFDIPLVSSLECNRYSFLVDAIFGFSFKGPAKGPFDHLLKTINNEFKHPIVSIDIPSGWDVEKGNIDKVGLSPETLVSLTAPKMCAQHFNGKHHVLGGRFISPRLKEKWGLDIPPFIGDSQYVIL